jgi:Tol biopolymer transport system component
MPLPAGTRLGPYELTTPLGAGGMGEVYRARDTRLGRDVAIKVLPAHLSANSDVRARFEREARTVSGLNHPHICTLFDVGREGDIDYIVMELIEGETLAHRLARGALPPAEVLRIGTQVADALDRSHRAGVIHRDLKPGNIMLTRSGAKLMDFGLARPTGLAGPAGASGVTMTALTQSPTVAAPLTAEGTILGTFQYMSPEQLEGKEADERSDIWALGCVLYEMATGRRAFEGRSQASLITAVMGSEPAPASSLSPATPPGLDRLIANCLVKDPEERIRTAHDVKLQLAGLAEGASSVTGRVAVATPAARGTSRLPWGIAALATLAALALVALLLTRRPAAEPLIRLTLEPPDDVLLTEFMTTSAISPDGRSVAFCARDTSNKFAIWIRPLDSQQATRLAEVVALESVIWAPDGRSIAWLPLLQSDQALTTIKLASGTATPIAMLKNSRGGSWGSRGDIIYGSGTQGPIFRVSATGGTPVQVTWLDSTRHEAGHRFPCFLPDGRHFLFVSLPAVADGFEVHVGSIESREIVHLMVAGSAPVYAEPGYLLYRRGEQLMAQRFDAARLELVGEPVALMDAPVRSDALAEPIASASTNGRLIVPTRVGDDRRLSWFEPSGLRTPVALEAGQWVRPVLSPDNRLVAIQNAQDLWRVDVARGSATRLTNGATNYDPIWSPDGKWIAFTSDRTGREEIFVIASDGSGEARHLPTTETQFKLADAWVGDEILVSSIGVGTGTDLWIVPADGSAPARPFIQTSFAERGARVSPDGRWVAYRSNESGADEDVYVQSFPVPGHKLRVTTNGVRIHWWAPDSRSILYRSLSGLEIVEVPLVPAGDGLEAGTPRLRHQLPADYLLGDLSADGRRMIAVTSNAATARRDLRVILNWPALLEH